MEYTVRKRQILKEGFMWFQRHPVLATVICWLFGAPAKLFWPGHYLLTYNEDESRMTSKESNSSLHDIHNRKQIQRDSFAGSVKYNSINEINEDECDFNCDSYPAFLDIQSPKCKKLSPSVRKEWDYVIDRDFIQSNEDENSDNYGWYLSVPCEEDFEY
eukprot:CAMPEP_0113952398 /NCGR_PEP_ID=MMETSP1339-20121228/90398_1 /TAXON_ID=94617 /ORGANISM="Fibrocapsa japonica" /LENGTH=158 /DNA_ID=CAMNT_0000961007 /DNA_START=133 /DNA_END=609 /DNA_ORIENTATION=- /assembly_acc=CAM_ASM_000762